MVRSSRGGELHKRGGRPSSGKAGASRGSSFLASTNVNHREEPRQSHGFTQTLFSLNEEARNTERYHSWNSDLRLRHSRIAFINAGTSTAEDLNPGIQKSKPTDEAINSSLEKWSAVPGKSFDKTSTMYTVTPDAQMSNMTLSDLQSVPASRLKSEMGLDSMSKLSNKDSDLECAEASNEAPLTHQEHADEPSNTGLVTPIMRRSPSPIGSDSSGEIIVFAGRRRSCNGGGPKHTPDSRSRNPNIADLSEPSGHCSSMVTIVDGLINAPPRKSKIYSKDIPSTFSSSDCERLPVYLSCHSRSTTTESRRRRRRRRLEQKMKNEEILDDYVANLREGGALDAFVKNSVFKQRDLGGTDTAEWQGEVATLTKALTDSETRHSAEEGFIEPSLSNEGPKNVQLILSKRERPSGVQYLVVGAGCSVDDARWFPVSSLNIQSAEALIAEFENNAGLDGFPNGSDVSDVSLTRDGQVARDLQELQEGFQHEEDEKDLKEMRKARMTDEQVARLLSKQDELGLGTDDLILYDGDEVGTDSQDELQLDGLCERAVTCQLTSRSKRMKRSRSNCLSASAFAYVPDQNTYNSFDMMDQQRPSLRKRAKGRRGKLPLELSDSELEHSIHTAWEKDRTKKKMRKQEREELRAQGLLGRKSEADLKFKYSEGISMTQVKKEIRDFLLSSMESLSLPPMAQGDRKIVHEIANVFKLKSKSTGGGRSRYPVLYRTSRTIQYSEETLKAADSVLFSGRFLPHVDKVRRKGTPAGRGHRGGATSAGVSYRDGEVVGAAAPEIGQENRGRTMLERMGWSTGTALGALNNSRGLVQPVAQVVKTSRSGLG